MRVNATSSDTNSNGVPDECEILTCVDVEPLGDPSPQRFLGGVPNPSSGLVQLRFALPACAGTTVGIFDVSGRSLRALALEPGASGIVWDGRDVGGRRARPGLYFVRLSSSCGSARGSILIMR